MSFIVEVSDLLVGTVRRHPRSALLVAALFLTCCTMLPYAVCRLPAGTDEAIFSYMAAGPTVAHLPWYQAGFDNKPPGIILQYYLTRAWDEAGLRRARLAQGGMELATALLLLLWLGLEISLSTGFLASLLYVLLVTFVPGCHAITEPPMALFTALSLFLGWCGAQRYGPGWWLAAGVSLGIAANFKQVAVVDLLALLSALVLVLPGSRRTRLFAGLAMLLGFAGLWAAVCGWLAASGQWPEFTDGVIHSLARGGASAPLRERPEHLFSYLRWVAPVTGGIGVAALLGCIFPPRGARRGLLVIWLVCASLGTASSGYLLYHQAVQYYAPLSALAALGVVGLYGCLRPRSTAIRIAVVVLLLAVMFAPLVNKYRIRMQQARAGATEQIELDARRLGQWLSRSLPAGETLYVLGNSTPIYFYARHRSPTRYFHGFILSTPALQEAALRELEAHPPNALVSTPDYYPVQRAFADRVNQVLLSDYLLVPAPGGDNRLYLRRDRAVDGLIDEQQAPGRRPQRHGQPAQQHPFGPSEAGGHGVGTLPHGAGRDLPLRRGAACYRMVCRRLHPSSPPPPARCPEGPKRQVTHHHYGGHLPCSTTCSYLTASRPCPAGSPLPAAVCP